jgi:hypothetical protein
MQKIFIVGEIHGSKSNTKAIERLVQDLAVKHVLFEWPADWKENIAKKVYSLKDGRIGPEYLVLFPKLQNQGVIIDCIDVAERDWNTNYGDREVVLATNVLNYQKNNQHGNILVVFGRIHARKKSFLLNRKVYTPAGAIIKKNLDLEYIEIKYPGGTIFNFEIKTLPQLKNNRPTFTLLKSRSPYFDYEYWVDTSEPLDIVS